jgi:hypothetical protein
MNQPNGELQPANWEITAVALPCDYIGDLVTIRVTREWLAECAWYLKYKSNTSKGKKLDETTRVKRDKCVGPDCPIVAKYRDKLIEEELGNK